jgi:hypothetical protein
MKHAKRARWRIAQRLARGGEEGRERERAGDRDRERERRGGREEERLFQLAPAGSSFLVHGMLTKENKGVYITPNKSYSSLLLPALSFFLA